MTVPTIETPSASRSPSAGLGPLRRLMQPAPYVAAGALLLVWAIAAAVAPATTVPSIGEVAAALREIVSDGASISNLFVTLLRVGAGLVGGFVLGSLLGVGLGAKPTAASYVMPVVRFIQGIPSLSWVVIAIIWFGSIEIRIWFIMLLVTLPGFILQLYDSYRAIPSELRDMARSFRPTRWGTFIEVIFPGVLPGVFTAWKVNLGLGIRVVLIAELVGATSGVGAQLLSAQQLFDMTLVVAWTLLMATSLVLIQGLVQALEFRLLAYRPEFETAGHTTARSMKKASS